MTLNILLLNSVDYLSMFNNNKKKGPHSSQYRLVFYHWTLGITEVEEGKHKEKGAWEFTSAKQIFVAFNANKYTANF